MNRGELKPGYLTLPDAARYLSICERTLRQMVYDREIPIFVVGKKYKFKVSELDKWMDRFRAS